jgi:hypothetical protein
MEFIENSSGRNEGLIAPERSLCGVGERERSLESSSIDFKFQPHYLFELVCQHLASSYRRALAEVQSHNFAT